MPKVTVHMPVYAELMVDVEVGKLPLTEEQADEVRNTAVDRLPSGVCHQCVGGRYNGQEWSFETEFSEADAKYMSDEDGNVVWGDQDGKLGWLWHSG